MLPSALLTRCRPTATSVRLICRVQPALHANQSALPRHSAFCLSSLFFRTLKTFIPFAGSTPEEGVLRSLVCLDDKRLGKQRVESQSTHQLSHQAGSHSSVGAVTHHPRPLVVAVSVSDLEDGARSAVRQHQAPARPPVTQTSCLVQTPSSQHVDGVRH